MNPRQVWQAALSELQAQVSRTTYDTWLKHVTLVGLEQGVCILGVPSSFAKEWLESRLRPLIERTLSGLVGQPIQIEVVVQTPKRSAAVPPAPLLEGLANEPESTPAPAPGPPSRSPWQPHPRYTFATFIVGPSNQIAHAAALAVAQRPAEAYNPLFIYGGVGLGKTHLLHAIGHVALSRGLRVLYVTSEDFTNDLIEAIRVRSTEEFRARYRTNDVLLVDDIQFLAGKEATQEEFFHTFNALHSANRQIVISSDRPPKAIAALEERLRSRFEWGLIADIQPPDFETRVAILRAKAEGQPVPVPPEVLDFLAQRIQRNIRELEGALNRVVAYAALKRLPLTVETAGAALRELLQAPARKRLTPAQVIEAVARYYRVDPRALRGKQRDRQIVRPRQVAMYLMREETEASLPEIGRELGGRDHTTVLHGWEKIKAEVEVDDELRKAVLAIREALYASAS